MIRATLSQTHHFILQKNYLAGLKATNLLQLVTDLAGLPGDPHTTPFLSAWARLDQFRPDQLLAELSHGRLIKSLLMQNGSYIIEADHYPLYHAATARQRNQEFNAEFRLWGVKTNEEIEMVGQAILAILGDQPLTAEVIVEYLPPALVQEYSQTSRGGRVTKTTNIALALRWLTAKGVLYAAHTSPDWRIETLSYAPLNQGYHNLDLSIVPDEAEAQKQVVRNYLAAYGPATEADISFWTGFGKSEVARASSGLNRETTLTQVEGIPGILLLLKSQVEALQAAAAPTEPIINILPAGDPYPTAHRASRSRYFADQSLQRHIFSSSGAARPTILIDGKIVGLWDWQTEAGQDRITWRLLTEVDSALKPLIQAEIEKAGAFIHPQTTVQYIG